MNKMLILNLSINAGITIVFVLLDMWSLKAGLEETFVFLTILYGAIITGANAFFVVIFNKK